MPALLLKSNTQIAGLVAVSLALMALARSKRSSGSSRSSAVTAPSGRTPSRKSVRVDAIFAKRLLRLLRIAIPRAVSREVALLVGLVSLLLLRTRLTITMSEIVGGNAKNLVNREARKFAVGVIDIGLWSLPSAVVNAGIKYLTSLLEGRFRNNLQSYVHDQYLREAAVYKVVNGNAVEHPDHRLTTDVLAFCTEVSEIFPLVFKPTIDVIVFIYQLSRNGGVLPPFLMIGYYLLAGNLMRAVMPNFAKLTAQTQQREGEFRAVHSQIIQHAEEVAFYRGERTERFNADAGINALVKHQLHVKQLKSFTDFMDGVLIKYGATCVGYAVCSMGVFGMDAAATAAERTRVYIQSSQLYIPLAQAIGKLVLLHHRITALAAYTTRVAQVEEVLRSLSATTTTSTGGSIVETSAGSPLASASEIQLEGATVATPSGEELLKDINLTVKKGESLLIMGNNGSGKSALLRSLVGLWPLAAGRITRPPLSHFVFVPQRTYLPHGDMRQQLIFPDTAEDAKRKNITDADIWAMVEAVGLTSVVQREGGLDGFKQWHEVLSGGERQRVAFVRVLYHRPEFAVLDEATSAVSQEIEPAMYEAVQKCGTTMITVSHREGLKTYHRNLCILDGEGGATVSSL